VTSKRDLGGLVQLYLVLKPGVREGENGAAISAGAAAAARVPAAVASLNEADNVDEKRAAPRE